MYKASAAIFLGAILLSVAPASATSTSSFSLTVTGTSGTNFTGSGTDGACGPSETANTWVDRCPSGSCTCTQVTPTKVSGTVKGATVTDFFVTNDSTDPVVGATVDSGPTPKCNLNFGALKLTSATQSQAINLLAVGCHTYTGISKKNPGGTRLGDTIEGGWGLDQTVSSPDSSGGGTFTGKGVKATSSVSATFTGLVTQ